MDVLLPVNQAPTVSVLLLVAPVSYVTKVSVLILTKSQTAFLPIKQVRVQPLVVTLLNAKALLVVIVTNAYKVFVLKKILICLVNVLLLVMILLNVTSLNAEPRSCV